jgi:hypothetical protein
VLICNINYAQVRLLTDGKIGIGTIAPTTDVEFYKPNILINFPVSTKDILITTYQDNFPVVRPTIANTGYMGLSANYWKQCWFRYGCFDDIYLINQIHWSDIRIKKKIQPLENSLENIMKLKPCRYDIDFSNTTSEHFRNISQVAYKNQFGFVAQELMEVYPELVKLDSSTNLYGINYTGLIAVLAAAIQEQNKKIKDLESKILANSSDNKSAETEEIVPSGIAMLGKNRPNPFSENSSIEYFLPTDVQIATLYIYDLQGKQLKSILVTGRDYGQVTIHGSELQPGMYHYSLIADGKIVGTEQMVLTD